MTDFVPIIGWVMPSVTGQDPETAGEVRWCDGRLQQKWTTRQYLQGGGTQDVYAWRDVPTHLRIDKVEALRAENEKVDDFWEVADATLATENAQLRRLLRRVHEEFWDWQDESAENWAAYKEIDRVLNHPRPEEEDDHPAS